MHLESGPHTTGLAEAALISSDDQSRRVYCNRTLNLRSIAVVGYDMDYTLIHYHVDRWEERAYEYLKGRLLLAGWPVGELRFDPDLVIRGLVIDVELGNVVKADRFGYVKYAFHGTRPVPFDEKKIAYKQTLVDLNDARWTFMNTLFSLSEACMYMQLVDLLDEGKLRNVMGYGDLYGKVRRSLDEAHLEGRLKAEIIANPSAFVDLDSEMPAALLDQRRAGKKVLLITNSEWSYAAPMLKFVFDDFLPGKMTWRDIFSIAVVGARKPAFFSHRMPTFAVVSDDGLLREHAGPLSEGGVYVGSNAALVEESLGVEGEEVLYVGDHIFADVNVSKSIHRWRTALIIRELEDEITALENFRPQQKRLTELMLEKIELEVEYSKLRLSLQRATKGYDKNGNRRAPEIQRSMDELRTRMIALDEKISPLAQASGALVNARWGPLMRTGKDKSHLARQVERYADVYTARVSNFLYETPYAYLRSHRGSLPHDSEPVP